MNIPNVFTAVAAAILVSGLTLAAPKAKTTGGPTQMVVTVHRAPVESRPDGLEAGDLAVLRNNLPASVVHLERLAGDLADMQLFVLLDDSSRSTSLGIQLPELKAFLESLPAICFANFSHSPNE